MALAFLSLLKCSPNTHTKLLLRLFLHLTPYPRSFEDTVVFYTIQVPKSLGLHASDGVCSPYSSYMPTAIGLQLSAGTTSIIETSLYQVAAMSCNHDYLLLQDCLGQ